jgi:transposase
MVEQSNPTLTEESSMTTPLSSGPRRRSLATAPCGGALRERLRYPELHHHRGHDHRGSEVDELTEEQWVRIEPLIPGGRKGKRGPRSNNRRFVNALLWMARSGGRWRDLPARLGNYHVVKKRYYRWIERGIIDALFETLSAEPDLEKLMIDSTVVRAHQHAAGAQRKKGGLMPRVWAAPEAA